MKKIMDKASKRIFKTACVLRAHANDVLKSKKGEGPVDFIIGVLIAVVIAVIVIGVFSPFIKDEIMPMLKEEVEGLFTTSTT